MPNKSDLASGCARTALFWGPGIALIVFTAHLGVWARTLGWTAGLLWLAALCLWNAARCRRVHCMFTGPFFLLMAVATLLVGFSGVSFGSATWQILGNTIAIGGVALWLLPELFMGRYWQSRKPAH
ncbi:MAG TPA: hypothetical protein VEY94_01945 [Patescibacteria group bacterium]|nr:hypothetical protein [Patescibacteria group bacterium]